ncbi:MAG: ATP-binding protein [Verrucomicrobia bacterium]|nr:ATP-binding protein [Verrucomicrobiota bacterium]
MAELAFKPMIKVLSGMRRVGKSTLLKLHAATLRERFPDITLLEIDKESMDWGHIRTGAELHAAAKEAFLDAPGRCALMVDEVQDISDWERALASILKSRSADIYVTGSNARVFSSELSDRLSGRHMEIPVHPLTYAEFLVFADAKDSGEVFSRFLRQGGMPGIHSISAADAPVFEYLRAVADTVVLKDVVSRHQIRNVRLLDAVLRFILGTSGSPVSAKRIADYLRSQNIRTSVDTVLEYLGYFVDARVLQRVPRHDIRGRKILEFNDKYYAGDGGLRSAILGHRAQDIGIQLETVVCNHLLAEGFRVEVGKWNDYEVDFVATKDSLRTYIQVAYLLPEPGTLERELRPLRAIGDQYPRLLLSTDPHFRQDHEGVRWMNIRNFLLSRIGD